MSLTLQKGFNPKKEPIEPLSYDAIPYIDNRAIFNIVHELNHDIDKYNKHNKEAEVSFLKIETKTNGIYMLGEKITLESFLELLIEKYTLIGESSKGEKIMQIFQSSK